MSDRIDITTKYLPELLTQLDSNLHELPKHNPTFSAAEYMQIGLLVKIAESLNDIKQELKRPGLN